MLCISRGRAETVILKAPGELPFTVGVGFIHEDSATITFTRVPVGRVVAIEFPGLPPVRFVVNRIEPRRSVKFAIDADPYIRISRGGGRDREALDGQGRREL